MALLEAQKGMTGLIPFDADCGATFEHYSFSQGDAEVTVKVKLPDNTAAKQLVVRMDTNSLFVALKASADKPILAGKFFKPIKSEDSTWCVEDRKVLVLTLFKTNRQYEEWWPCVCEGEPQCDFKTLKPPSKHMRELDGGAQAQIQKMMFDQDQKRKGQPTSDEQLMQEALKKQQPQQ